MRKTSTALSILGAVLAVLIITGVSAQGPAPTTLSGPGGQIQASGDTINFQGRLLDSASDPAAAGTYSMRFTICTSPTDQTSCSGSAVWSGTYSVDVVAGGLFNVLLTGIDADDLTAATTYLMAEVWTGSAWDWMDPNQQITSVAIAIGNIRKNLPDTTTAGTAGYLLTVSNTGTGGGLAASGAVVGLYGESTATNGAGVEGYNAANIGVYGESDTGEGVHGYATDSSGDVFGVVGHAQSTTYYVPPAGASAGVVGSVATADDYGVFGINPNTSGRAFGVVGLAASTTVNEPSGTNTAVGVLGSAEWGTDYAVYGENSSTAAGYGIFGISSGTTSGGYAGVGVVGANVSASGQGFGVLGAVGTGLNTPGSSSAAVLGSASRSTDIAVYASNSASTYAYGVIALANSTTAAIPPGSGSTALSGRVRGSADWAVIGVNSNTSGGHGVHGEGYYGVYGISTYAAAGYYHWGGYFAEDLYASRYGSALAWHTHTLVGSEERTLYAMNSPENWFEDFGTAALVDGRATVLVEPLFAQTVNMDVDYHVFLTPLGDCRGLYVAAKGPASFEVRELGGGKANIAFDYRIVAKRLGQEEQRLERFESPTLERAAAVETQVLTLPVETAPARDSRTRQADFGGPR